MGISRHNFKVTPLPKRPRKNCLEIIQCCELKYLTLRQKRERWLNDNSHLAKSSRSGYKPGSQKGNRNEKEKRSPTCEDDLRTLKSMARDKQGVKKIAKALKRTTRAVENNIASAKASPPLKTESQVKSTIGPVNCASPCDLMCQVFRLVKSSSPGPIFVFLWKATRLRSQNRLMMVIAVLSSPPGLLRMSTMMPSKSLKSPAILSRAAVKLPSFTPSSSRIRM